MEFIVNIIHRPEMVPEYAEKVTGHGKEEDIGRKALLRESLDIFLTQQECAHKNGLKTTFMWSYKSVKSRWGRTKDCKKITSCLSGEKT